MVKDIVKYLHYYLGCEIKAEGKGTMTYTLNKIGANGFASFKDKNGFDVWLGEGWKPILRKLDSMEQEDIAGLASAYGLKDFVPTKANCGGNFIQMEYQQKGASQTDYIFWHVHQLSAPMFHHLLSRGFWLFGNDWFDEGYIIDKSTLK